MEGLVRMQRQDGKNSADLPADSKTAAQSKGNRVSHSEKSRKRICWRCGKPIEGPNYFLCKKCHTFMSR